MLKLRNAKEKEAEHCDTCFPAGRIECTDRKEKKQAGTGGDGDGTADRRGKTGKERAVICWYIGFDGQSLFEVYTIEWDFPAKLVDLTEVIQFLT